MVISRLRMAGWRNKIEKRMDSVVPETRVTFNAGLFGKDVVVLTFEVVDNFLESKNISKVNI
jgi:hypothetical protein